MRLPTLDDYRRLMRDRPVKFSGKEANLRGSEHPFFNCRHCYHWYESPASGFRVCEVVRPEGAREEVEPSAVCDFWNVGDGKFPLYRRQSGDHESGVAVEAVVDSAEQDGAPEAT